MAKLFNKYKSEGLEQSDTLGGGFQSYDTDIYESKIKQFYVTKSSGGADAANITLLINGKEYRETVYFSSKDGNNFYIVKDKDKNPVVEKDDQGNPRKEADGSPMYKKKMLPGFEIVNDLCLCATGEELEDQDFEDKMVKVWDNDAKKEVLKSLPVATSLIDQDVAVAISKNLENKSVKQGNDFVATAETRDTNNIAKVFHLPSKRTVTEIRNEVEEAAFWTAWLEKNKGKVADKRTIKDGTGGTSGRPGGSTPAQGQQAPKKTLFNKG